MKKNILLLLLAIVALLVGQTAQAQIYETEWTIDGGSQMTGNESVHKLLDGNVHTKWCQMCNPYADPLYVEFHSSVAFVPTGYILTTADDNTMFNYRYPTIWKVKAKVNKSDPYWIDLSYVSNKEALTDQNCAPYEFGVDNESHQWFQYFRIEIYNIRSVYIDYFQLSEFQFKGYNYLDDMKDAAVTFSKPVFDYNNGNPETISYTVTDGLGNPIAESNYTASTDPATVSAEGQYTLILTGQASFKGTKQVTFWVKNQLSGAGTEASPYMINSDADWDLFAERVRLGDTYAGKFVKLGADINVTTMAGSSEACSFKGTFDGNYKTMTVKLTATEDACAPFRYLKDAQVKNLNITGSVSSSYHYAGGLVAYGYGTCVFTNCTSQITINSTRGDRQKDFHGGFIAVYYPKWSLTFTDCIFAGKMLGANSYGVGGYVGYSYATVYYNHCLYAGTEFTMDDENSYSFNGNSNYSYFRGAYITDGIDPWYGTKVYTDLSSFSKVEFDYAGVKYCTQGTVQVEGLNSSYDETGSVIDIHPTLYYDTTKLTENVDYEVTTDPMPVKDAGGYTMYFTGKGGYAGTEKRTFVVNYHFTGDGSAANPYLIPNKGAWECFAYNVSNGMDYSGQFVKLSDTFDNSTSPTTMMAGKDGYPFKGTFDGNYKTLTINLSGGDKYLAPFCMIENATIKDLTVTGTISSTVDGDGTHGGFAGVNHGNSYLTNCAFTGSMLGEKTTSCGGFVGWNSGQLYITGGVFNPDSISMSSYNSATFNRNGHNVLTRCYYTSSFGEVQGLRVTDDANTVHTNDIILVAGVNYYRKCDISGVNKGYKYTGSAVSVTPVVKFEDKTLVENTDYTVAYTNSTEPVTAGDLVDVGQYTIIISGMGNYTGSASMTFYILDKATIVGQVFQEGEDEEGRYYEINNVDDYNRLGALVAYPSANNTTSGLRFKLMANISVSTIIGTNEDTHSFQGIFDGNGHTLTVNLEGGNDQYLAPFRYAKGATFRNLIVDGTISSTRDGDGTHGGFVAINRDSTTFENCVFSGSLLGEHTNCCGGFVGWNNGKILYIDCLFNPDSISMDSWESATFNRNNGCDFVRTYYVTRFGTPQGSPILASKPTGTVCDTLIAADGNTYYTIRYYVVGSEAEWEVFAQRVLNEEIGDYPVRMTADVTVSSSVGSRYHPFRGTFYGNGKTLTVNLNDSSQITAPFGYLDDAFIHDLTIDGTITYTGRYKKSVCGGFAGVNLGWNTIFNNCIFKGRLLSTNTPCSGENAICDTVYSGGFVGWNYGNITYRKCLFAPTEVTISDENAATFNTNANSSFTQAYYLTPFGKEQGTRIYEKEEDIPAGCIANLDTIFTGDTCYIDCGLKIDNSFSAGEPGYYYVDMPVKGTDYYTIPSGIKSFKIYDDGGKDHLSSENCSGAVVLTAPKGCKLEAYGVMQTYGYYDGLWVYDADCECNHRIGWWGCDPPGEPTLIDIATTSQESMYIGFYVDEWLSQGPGELNLTIRVLDMTLQENLPNDSVIQANLGDTVNAVLSGRRFYPDAWNTLCLPFNFSAAQLDATVLRGAILKELDTAAGNYSHITGYEDGKLYLNFKDADSICAGVPYLIKWDNHPWNFIPDQAFPDVVISKTTPYEVTSADGYVSFVGTFSPVNIFSEDKTNLYLGDDNWLLYPWDENMRFFFIRSCRAYFRLNNGLTAGSPHLPGLAPLQIMLNFDGEGAATDLNPETADEALKLGSTKFLRNGQLYIRREGVVYDGLGRVITNFE